MLVAYRIIYFLLFIVAQILKPFLSSDLKAWIILKERHDNKNCTSENKRILFHAASGEIEYVKSVIREIKNGNPDIEIIVSYTSPSAEKLFLNIKDYVTEFIPLPWDTPTKIQNFLNAMNPDVIVFSRTDFWPEFIYQAHKKNIPMIAVSLFCRFSFFQNIWLKFNLSKMKVLTTVSKKTTDTLKTFLNLLPKIISPCRRQKSHHRSPPLIAKS